MNWILVNERFWNCHLAKATVTNQCYVMNIIKWNWWKTREVCETLMPPPYGKPLRRKAQTANNWNFYRSKGHKSVKICPIIPTIELGLHVLCAHHICHTSQTHTTALSDAGLSREQIMSALEDTFRPCMKAFSVLINDWLLKIKAYLSHFLVYLKGMYQ